MRNDFHDDVFGRDATDDDLKQAKARFWAKMRNVFSRIPFARQAAALYYLIRDPKADVAIKGTSVLALLYFISPLDFVPDMIPITGMLDDASVVAGAIAIIGPALGPYLKMADLWLKRGAPLTDDADDEIIRDAELITMPNIETNEP